MSLERRQPLHTGKVQVAIDSQLCRRHVPSERSTADEGSAPVRSRSIPLHLPRYLTLHRHVCTRRTCQEQQDGEDGKQTARGRALGKVGWESL